MFDFFALLDVKLVTRDMFAVVVRPLSHIR